MNKYCMGIDTSAYTTSIAIINQDSEVIVDKRIVLNVKKGKLGLRQQEAVFQHINNLPQIISYAEKYVDLKKIKTVSASTKPRNIENSYMPVFKAGEGYAITISKILGIEFKRFSHQEGHIASGILNSEMNDDEPFLVLHISGGTTELLYVKNTKYNYDIKIIGGTKDISAGQLIDRIGVKAGLEFPSGKAMEYLSRNGNCLSCSLPISCSGNWTNFSGAETYFKKIIDSKTYNINDIAKSVFYVIGCSLANIIVNSLSDLSVSNILIIGGVAANLYIRDIIRNKLMYKNIKIYYPQVKYCTDNAVGIAYLGLTKNKL